MLGRLLALGAVGATAAYVLVKLGPGIGRAAEPAVRAAVKSQIKTLQKVREVAAHLVEVAEDAYAEAWADLNREAAKQDGEKTDGPPTETTRDAA